MVQYINQLKRLVVVCFVLLLLCSLPMAAAAQEAPASPGKQQIELPEEGVCLVIDKKANRLTVYLNGYAVRSFAVATGRSKWLTPSGKFEIVTKIVKPWYMRKNIPGGDRRNPLGTRWLGLSVPGTGGYTYGIHGTNRPYSIGSHASSGCIRMLNRDVEWLYRHIPLKTIVYIKE